MDSGTESKSNAEENVFVPDGANNLLSPPINKNQESWIALESVSTVAGKLTSNESPVKNSEIRRTSGVKKYFNIARDSVISPKVGKGERKSMPRKNTNSTNPSPQK